MGVNIEIQEGKQKRKDYSKRNKKTLILSILCLGLFLCIGCLENTFFTSRTVYESSPVIVSYDIQYGYRINTTGNGISTIHYEEYIPQSQNGIIKNVTIQPSEKTETDILGNQRVFWNQTLNQSSTHFFTISASIIQEPIIISDLTGNNALSIQEIQNQYPSITAKYTKKIGNETTTIIDPSYPPILKQAQEICMSGQTNNSFIIAKQLFSFLKNHTSYEKHESSKPQSAKKTYETQIGDCDDLTYLYLSLCRAVGIPSRYVKGYLLSNSNAVPHVWGEIFVGKRITESGWIPVECAGNGHEESEIHNHFGMQNIYHLRLITDDGTNESFNRFLNPIKIEYEPSLQISINRIEIISNYQIQTSKKLIIEDNNRKYE